MRTLVDAAEPEPVPRLAMGGIVTGPRTVPLTDGCIWPIGGGTVAGPPGNVSVTFELSPDAGRIIAERIREPIRTTAHVGRPIPEIEE